jgi:hypothetical protein
VRECGSQQQGGEAEGARQTAETHHGSKTIAPESQLDGRRNGIEGGGISAHARKEEVQGGQRLEGAWCGGEGERTSDRLKNSSKPHSPASLSIEEKTIERKGREKEGRNKAFQQIPSSKGECWPEDGSRESRGGSDGSRTKGGRNGEEGGREGGGRGEEEEETEDARMR